MPYHIKAQCGACHHTRARLAIGDGEHTVAGCPTCKSVVNAWYDRFRPLDPVACPECPHFLEADAFFFTQLNGPLYPCPHCGETQLGVTTELHYSCRTPEPEVGREVQVHTLTARHAHLSGRLLPIDGGAPALHWVEAVVTKEGLRYLATLGEWRQAQLAQIVVEIRRLREPWLRVDLAAVVKRFRIDTQQAWWDFSLLADPLGVAGVTEGRTLTVRLENQREEFDFYLEALAERFDELGGEWWDGQAWVRATLRKEGRAWTVGSDRVEALEPARPAPPPPAPLTPREEKLQKARQLLEADQAQAAVQLLKSMVREDPVGEKTRADFLEPFVIALAAAGRQGEADLWLPELVAACPGRGELHERLAELCLLRQDSFGAVTSFRNAAAAYRDAGRNDDAERCLDRAVWIR